MTPRLSARAAARRSYEEMMGEGGVSPQLGTPTPDPSSQGGGEKTDLMARVRALYEDTAAPVRDIARRAGISERTLYKYARKNNWKPRYAWLPDGSRPPEGRPARHRWSEAQENEHAHAAQFAPAKGAGGRFIRREDKGQPFPQGIKATDPAARASAAQAAAAAQRAARQAQAEAGAEAQLKKHLRIIDNVTLAFAAYNRFRRDRAEHGPGEYDDELLRLHAHIVETAMRRWEQFTGDEDLGMNAIEPSCACAPVTSACDAPS